ncbi:MlaD family protein [Sedimentimonas flavescens]|uniref:MlaD family protein n=1 Tax=Sedimentimonas flavescens TaxID=2851012 RepID=UPI0021A4F8AC|nr:MlaD family protein [Sedimentimonas flavescens]MCT2539856.1 MlaD family protein [Sedimentimonas flavescens]WBL33348.1 MlaD family protein [Sinirhodobacter sp. HNIBRBA609]
MTDELRPADLETSPAPNPIWTRLSVIWLVPLVALAITLGIAWQSYADRGTLIEIDFADATGVRPGETVLKFREVEVGRVETVGFSPDLSSVRIGVRVNKDVAHFVDSEARFWLVRPQVSAQGISRLDTVLSGTFIEGYWDAESAGPQTEFQGLDKPPVTPDPTKGTWVELRAEDAGGLAEGAPVLFRGITVGRIQNLRLNDADSGVIIDAFIDAPHDRRLTTNTRFWDTSGISVSLSASGVSLDMRSLASLVQGGIEFDTFTTGGTFIQNGFPFRLYGTSEAARTSIFGSDLAEPARYTLLFDDAIEGLQRGSKVQFRGVEAGEVTDLSIKVLTDSTGTRYAQQQVVIALSPERLGLARGTERDIVNEFLATEVDSGLRARVAGVGLLGSTLVIELTDVPNVPPAVINLTAQPYPTLPTAEAKTNDLAASAEGVFQRIEALPIEELMASAIRSLDSISAVAESEDTRAVPGELAGLLEELRALVERLNQGGASEKAIAALDGMTEAASTVMSEFEGLAETLASTDAAAQAVAEMPLGEIGNKIDGILADIRTMLGSEDAERLPRALSDTLEESAALLAELREGGAAEKINGTLVAAQDAATAIESASERLPELTAKLESLVTTAERLVASYGERSAFNAEVLDTMRELRRATSAFGSLARMIERNPRAFILGR